jgi:hypothetical protein
MVVVGHCNDEEPAKSSNTITSETKHTHQAHLHEVVSKTRLANPHKTNVMNNPTKHSYTDEKLKKK